MAKKLKLIKVVAIALCWILSFQTQAQAQLKPLFSGVYNPIMTPPGHLANCDWQGTFGIQEDRSCVVRFVSALDFNLQYLLSENQSLRQEIENNRAELISKMTATLKEQIKAEILEELRREGKL